MTNPSSPADVDRVGKPLPWRRRVWDRIPGWARAGLWGLLVLLLVQIAVGVKIWYGLQDPPEVAAIRGPGRHISLPEATGDFRSPLTWIRVAPTGLRGVSGKDVTAVRLDEQATDELIAHIAKHFPNVHSLYFSGGEITSQGLLALKNCPHLYSLDVSETNVDDGLGALLPHLPWLWSLTATRTNVGDEFTRAASRHERLDFCLVEGTNVTPAAVAEWQAARPKTRIVTDFGQSAIRAVIRWADGETSRRFSGPYEIGIYGPQKQDGSGGWTQSSTMMSTGLQAYQLQWSQMQFKNEHQDGAYQLRLKLGDIDAEPVDFTVENGVPSVSRIEFRMPVPRPTPPQ